MKIVYWKVFLGLFLGLLSISSSATDYEEGVRSIRRHDNWISFGFKNADFGFFMFSRASTEQKSKEATFVVDFYPDKESCREETMVVLKMDGPFQEGKSQESVVELSIDNREPLIIPAEVEFEKGDWLVYFTLKGGPSSSDLIGVKSIIANVKGWRVTQFNFKGFASARQRALELCKNFRLPPDSPSGKWSW